MNYDEPVKAALLHKLFGGGWYLGPDRTRELANYALDLFDAQVAPIWAGYEGTSQAELLNREIATMKTDLESTILTWENESLGPETGLGVPFAEGAGGKDRYRRYIDNWVRGLIVRIMWDLGPAKHEAMAGVSQGAQGVGPARLTPGEGAWNILSRAQGLPLGARPLQEQIADNADFTQRAARIASEYPEIMPALRDQFIKDAFALVARQGLDVALTSLRNQLESIQEAGRKKQGN